MKPEKQVEHSIIRFLNIIGWDVHVYESKAAWSVRAGKFLKNRSLVEGHPDIAGCDKYGRAIYIELKAKGIKVVRKKQYDFLKRKIELNCLAGVVRSVDEFKALLGMDKAEMLVWLDSFTVK